MQMTAIKCSNNSSKTQFVIDMQQLKFSIVFKVNAEYLSGCNEWHQHRQLTVILVKQNDVFQLYIYFFSRKRKKILE